MNMTMDGIAHNIDVMLYDLRRATEHIATLKAKLKSKDQVWAPKERRAMKEYLESLREVEVAAQHVVDVLQEALDKA